MASNHASYATIGLTVVLGIVAITATLVYIGGAGGADRFMFAETYYDRSVSGLSVGSTVNFRGVKVGEVKEISFVGNKYETSDDDAQRIYILMAFRCDDLALYSGKAKRLLDRGLRATVTASGVTGLSRIELDLLKQAAPPPPISWQPKNLYIPPAPSLMSSFSDSATKVMNQINKMDLDAAWSNIHVAVESVSRATESAMTTLETRRADFARIIENIAEASESLRELAAELKRNPSLLLRERTEAPLDETR